VRAVLCGAQPIGFAHFAHSYVRGNWRNEQVATFSLLAKSCHDIDLLCYWMGDDNPAVRVSSMGSLKHFTRSNKPAAAKSAIRCMDCAYESQCPYSARRMYLEPTKMGETGWPLHVLTEGVPDVESITAALEKGPYGRCVYECDNDVADNQTVQIQFAKGPLRSLCAHRSRSLRAAVSC
jgi:hypothetical protein